MFKLVQLELGKKHQLKETYANLVETNVVSVVIILDVTLAITSFSFTTINVNNSVLLEHIQFWQRLLRIICVVTTVINVTQLVVLVMDQIPQIVFLVKNLFIINLLQKHVSPLATPTNFPLMRLLMANVGTLVKTATQLVALVLEQVMWNVQVAPESII